MFFPRYTFYVIIAGNKPGWSQAFLSGTEISTDGFYRGTGRGIMKRTVLVALMVFLGILVLAGCSSPSSTAVNPGLNPPATVIVPTSKIPSPAEATPAVKETVTVKTGNQVGQMAPNFMFNDNGQTVSLTDFRGQEVMVNFWATWCGPCKVEMPLIQALADNKERAASGLVLLTVNYGESVEAVNSFMQRNGYRFKVLCDSSGIMAQSYSIRYVPTTLFIGRDGMIQHIQIGAFTEQKQIDQILDAVLK